LTKSSSLWRWLSHRMAHSGSSPLDDHHERFTNFPHSFRSRTSAFAPNRATILTSQPTLQRRPPIPEVPFPLFSQFVVLMSRIFASFPRIQPILLTLLLSSRISPLDTRKKRLSRPYSRKWDWCRPTRSTITEIRVIARFMDLRLLISMRLKKLKRQWIH
jgi:hypothetical protein